jgi:hypothetical protein
MSIPSLALLNAMAGSDFEAALDRHLEWGLSWLDLKDQIFGKALTGLTVTEAERAAQSIAQRGMRVYCLSSTVFASDIEVGEGQFRARHEEALECVIDVARILKPVYIRLIGAQTSRRSEVENSAAYLQEQHPWVFNVYAGAIDRISEAGFNTVIENEVDHQILVSPVEICDFFATLKRPGKVKFTWDIANSWQAGAFPTLETYRKLKSIIGYIHVKGGRSDAPGAALRYASSLSQAMWPVREIVSAAIRDNVSPVICLNPPHGAPAPGDDLSNLTERDLRFMRDLIATCKN